jgi:hypothetical protein
VARGFAAVVVGVAFVVACGTQPERVVSTVAAEPDITSDERGVAVTITGVVSAATTLCPAEQPACGSALVLDGAAGDATDGDFVVGQGWYDGHRVTLARPLIRGESPFTQAPSQQDSQFSEQQLNEASDAVVALWEQGAFVIQGGFAIDELRNRVVVPIEAIDQVGRAALDRLAAVLAVPFIELLDRPLAELPPWHRAVEGNVDLLTYAARVGGGMAALATFTLQYDTTGNCLFTDAEGRRYAVVWPFGYSATQAEGVVTVFDTRGDRVAVTGEQIQLGGGGDSGVGDGGEGGWIDRATYGSSCAATAFWIVNAG